MTPASPLRGRWDDISTHFCPVSFSSLLAELKRGNRNGSAQRGVGAQALPGCDGRASQSSCFGRGRESDSRPWRRLWHQAGALLSLRRIMGEVEREEHIRLVMGEVLECLRALQPVGVGGPKADRNDGFSAARRDDVATDNARDNCI